jgi:phosphopantothenoylcysteine decarboxylase/phosphopantothenate--cysteine ligase
MGYALAEAARDAGAQVVLISAPTCLPAVYGVEMVAVRTAQEMHDAVLARATGADLLIMAAAVADYRPARMAEQKIKKDAAGNEMVLELMRTPDILAAVAGVRAAGGPSVVAGFAAETEHLVENARDKLRRKSLDLIVANDVSASDSGFGVDTNRVTLLAPDQEPEELPLMQKFEVAERVVARAADLWRARHA